MAKQNVQEKAAEAMNSEHLDNFIETASNISDHAVETSRRAVDKSVKDTPTLAGSFSVPVTATTPLSP